MWISIHGGKTQGAVPWRAMALSASVGCIGLLAWAVIATAIAWNESRDIRSLRSRAARLEFASQAGSLELLRNEQLHRVFGNLHRYDVYAETVVNIGCVERFHFSEDTIAVFLANRSGQPMAPRFELRFLNAYGFVTGVFRNDVPGEVLASGRQLVCTGDLRFRYGTPVYYSVDLLEDATDAPPAALARGDR